MNDEPFIAQDVEELLVAHGYGEITALSRGSEALSWLEINAPRLAIVDPRLAVVHLLTERGTPFVVYTGEMDSLTDPGTGFRGGRVRAEARAAGGYHGRGRTSSEIRAATDRH